MKNHLLSLITMSLLAGGTPLLAQVYDVTLPQQCNLNDPATNEILVFPNTVGNADGDATLTIASIGDIALGGTSNENLDYYDENNVLIGQTGNAGNCNIDNFSYTMPLTDVLAFSADGQIEITVVPRNGVNDLQCSAAIGTASYCSTGQLTYQVSTGPNDCGVVSIDEPSNCEGTHDVVVTIRNYGTNLVTPVMVNWSVDGNVQIPVSYATVLDTTGGFGSTTAQVTLGTVTLANITPTTISAWTSMPNGVTDTSTVNDSAMAIIDPVPTVFTFPYNEDFETGQGDWYTEGTNNSWAFGTPAKSVIVGASSGMNAFVTGGLGTTPYNNEEKSYVYSPCFDFTEFAGTPWVALDVWWDIEQGWDGAALQTSIDRGDSWQTIGQLDDPYNWYTDSTLEGLPGGQNHGWTGTGTTGSGGWVNAKHDLEEALIGKLVQFRVAFGSDQLTVEDGIGFDDFRIVDYTSAQLGPDVRSLCQASNITLESVTNVNGDFLWSNSATTPTIMVSSTGTYWVEYTDTLIDLSSSDTIVIIQTTPPSISFAEYADTVYLDGNTTLDPQLPFDLKYEWSPGGFDYPYLVVRGSDYSPGVYNFSLKVTDSVLCTDQAAATIVVLNITGIREHAVDLLNIFPNPVDAKLNVLIQKPVTNRAEIRLFDMQGRMVYRNFFNLSGNSQLEINMDDLTPGVYMIHVNTGGDTAIRKIVKNP